MDEQRSIDEDGDRLYVQDEEEEDEEELHLRFCRGAEGSKSA